MTVIIQKLPNVIRTLLSAPTLVEFKKFALEAGYRKYEDNITMSLSRISMKKLAQNVMGILDPNPGHWIPEQRSKFLVDQLINFFGGKSAISSK